MSTLISQLRNAVNGFNARLNEVVQGAVDDIETGLVNNARSEGIARCEFPVNELSRAAIIQISNHFRADGFIVHAKRSHHQGERYLLIKASNDLLTPEESNNDF